jgi:Tfp pilus assembly protein PilE
MADYYSVIARAVSRLPSKTDEARHAIYDRARTAVQESLRTHDPPLSPPELATERFALEAAISRVETELRPSAREETTISRSGLTVISGVKEFVRWVRERLDRNISIIRNRLRLGETTKVVPAKAAITERLATFVQITQLKAKNIGRRISSLNWKATTVVIVLILAALVAIGYLWPSEKATENAAQEQKQQEAENEHERTAQRSRCQAEQKRWSIVSASQIEISDASLTGIGNDDYNISAVINNKSESKVIGLRLSVTARDCPTQGAQVADCDIFGRVETFESDVPAGEVRQINRKITIRGVAKPRYVVSPRLAVNGVRAALNQSDDPPANDLLSGWLRGCK